MGIIAISPENVALYIALLRPTDDRLHLNLNFCPRQRRYDLLSTRYHSMRLLWYFFRSLSNSHVDWEDSFSRQTQGKFGGIFMDS